MKTKLIGLSALALSLSLAQAPVAFADHAMMKEYSHERMEKIAEKLDLTTEQKTKMKAIRHAAHEKIKTIHTELRAVHTQVDEAYKTDTINESKIDGFVNQEKDLMGQMLKIRMMERLDIHNILDAKQKEKMGAMVQKWKEKHAKKEHHKEHHDEKK